MIREFTIKNFKSIVDQRIELGQFNVFIGENGAGKTNILEAFALAGASLSHKLGVYGLHERGLRVARPSIVVSAFSDEAWQAGEIRLECVFDVERDAPPVKVDFYIVTPDAGDIQAGWLDRRADPGSVKRDDGAPPSGLQGRAQLIRSLMAASLTSEAAPPKPPVQEPTKLDRRERRRLLGELLGDYVIYQLNALALRGIQNVSPIVPLGIHGENLDVLMSAFNRRELKDLEERSKLASWVDSVAVDDEDKPKFMGYKIGASTSTLYIRDRFMPRSNNTFSAENSGESILYILFYLALFISRITPKVFGIDTIETALSPGLCRDLIRELAALSKVKDKQALITTTSPAVLDGLNLNDDDQRLFVVSRNSEGHTVTKRIRTKPDWMAENEKLSQLWIRGQLDELTDEP